MRETDDRKTGNVGEETVDTVQGNVKEDRISTDRGGMAMKSGDELLFSTGSRGMRAREKVVVILRRAADRAEGTFQWVLLMHYFANRKKSMDPFQDKDVSKGVLKTECFEESPVNLVGGGDVPGGDDVVLEIF